MRIGGFKRCIEDGLVSCAAELSWEGAKRNPLVAFAEVDATRAVGFAPSPSAFLAASFVPAWAAGEERILVDGPVCAFFLLRLRSVAATLGCWYPDLGPPPRIEVGETRVEPRSGESAVVFLSCGIDSLATLRWMGIQLPRGHLLAVSAALTAVHAQTPSGTSDEHRARTAEAEAVAGAVATDAGVDHLPVVTNFWWIADDGYLYDEKWHGGLLASLAHLFGARFNRAYIASSAVTSDLEPWGSHPILDLNYSTSSLDIEHHALDMTRLEKTQLVADWPAGFHNLRVCQRATWDANCGTCEKCIRTRLALVALGRRGASAALPAEDVSPDLIGTIEQYEMISSPAGASYYEEMLPALRDRHRGDLVAAIERHVLSRWSPPRRPPGLSITTTSRR